MFCPGAAAFVGRIILDEKTVNSLYRQTQCGFRDGEGRRIRETAPDVREQFCRPISKFGVSCASAAGPEYHLPMKVATGTVVKGTIIVDDPEFKDGTDVFILTREREDDVHLSAEELAELEAGIAEADRGDMIPGDEFFARLRRYG